MHSDIGTSATLQSRTASGLRRFLIDPLEHSQPGAVSTTPPTPSAAQQTNGEGQQSTNISAVPAPETADTAGTPRGLTASAGPQGTVRAVPLPALRLEHFQTADVGAILAPADAVEPSAVSLTSLTNFDHAAYAEFQALFDVPAGQSAPYLLPPEQGRGRSEIPSAASPVVPAASTAKQAQDGVTGVAAREPKYTGQLHDDIARRVQEYLHSEAGRNELARALHQLNDSKAGS